MCAACGSGFVAPVRLSRFAAVHCRTCGHVGAMDAEAAYASAAEVYDNSYVGFVSDPVFMGNVRSLLARAAIPKGATVLDVGCGGGDFLHVAQVGGFNAVGIDVSEAAVGRCRARGLIATVQADPTGGPFDAVTMWDVIEHVPDPVRLLERARTVAAEEAKLIVKTPQVSERAVKLAELHPLIEAAWLQTAAHIQLFTNRSLETALHRSGWRPVQQSTVERLRSRAPLRSAKMAGVLGAEWLGRRVGGMRQQVVIAKAV